MLGDRKTVVLRGGAPWGFRLSGGGQTPVYIAKVFVLFFLPISRIYINYRFEVEVRQHLEVLQLVIQFFQSMEYLHCNNHYEKLMILLILFVIN